VPQYIDALIANWAAADTRAMFDGALDAVDAWSRTKSGKDLAQLSPADLDTVVAAYDADAFSRGDWPYRRLKDLIVTTYYTTEAGATQELRYELAPGVWEASIPADASTRCWAV
ncbi:MAG: gluconate 2-dehydrogenase subunit 3 family protein, partial [Brevundimonas sp.]